MRIIKNKLGKRRQDRIRGVLPVRLRGKDSSGVLFESLAHTLDLTPTGVRLGAIRHELKALDTVIVLFRKRRIEFTVMWSRMLDRHEYQAGLQMVAMESDPCGPEPGSGPHVAAWGIGRFRGGIIRNRKFRGKRESYEKLS